MKIPTVISILLLCLLGQPKGITQDQAVSYWGAALKQGPYQIGFRTLFTYDQARAAIPYSDWDGKLTYSQATNKGRQMQINIWYPAKRTGNPIKYLHYINLLGRQINFSPDNTAFAKEIFIDQTNALGGEGHFTMKQLEKIAALNTRAYLEAPATKGKFPLVIFPNGGSPAYQSIMCEYLASHGYVVAAVALKGQYSSTTDVSTKGLEVATDDLKFTLNQLLALENVDRNQVGLMANAIASSMCTALASKNSLIKVLISLEGGLLSNFEQRLLQQTNFYTPSAIQIPILGIYAPHPSISPDFIKHLKYSQRFFIHFPGMTEFHFLNYGLLERTVPRIIGAPKGDTEKGFAWAAQLSLKFLDAKLKADKNAQDFFANFRVPPTATEVIDTVFTMPALVAPPNIVLLKDLFITEGMQAIDSIYQSLRGDDPQVFPLSFYTEFRDWLAWNKDPDYQFRAQLYKMATESFPKSAVAHFYRAYFAEKMHDTALAKAYYRLALDLAPTDEDPNFTNSKRKILEEQAQKALARLQE